MIFPFGLDSDRYDEPGLQGVRREYGQPNTPLTQGKTRRFHDFGMVEDNKLFEPLSGSPFWQAGAFQQAHMTGKSGEWTVYEGTDMVEQEVSSGDARSYIFTQPPIMPDGSKARLTGVIDPWGTIQGNPNLWAGVPMSGSKFPG